MKKNIITILLSLLILTAYSRELGYEIHGAYKRPVRKEKLQEARLISDFIAGYPVHWVTDYISVEILTTINGDVLKAVSTNDVLSTEQKDILTSAEIGTEIVVNVTHKSKNAVTDSLENNIMHVSMTVVPEIEAEYESGYQNLKKYLAENAIDKISETFPIYLQGIVAFTVTEEGEITDAKISLSSGDANTDNLLLETINKMPKWKPAEDGKGKKVKQNFELVVGNGGC